MINRDVLMSEVRRHMMNKTLTMIAEEAFFLALPYSFGSLESSEKNGLHEFVSVAIEQLGGAENLLKTAIEETKNDDAKNQYMKNMYSVCKEAATTVANRVANEAEEDIILPEAVQKTNFTEEEFKKFETSADKLDLDDVAKIVSEKVIATIKKEQESYAKEQEIAANIEEALVSDANEETKDDAVESYMNFVLDKDMSRHYVSLFSKLTDVATEALAVVHPDELDQNIGTNALADTVFLLGLDSYRRSMSATESIERLLTLDAKIVNDKVYQESAMESLNKAETFQKGFTIAATAYTFLETMSTLNLHSPSIDEIDHFVNSNITPVSYGTNAVESFIKESDTLFAALESNVRKMNDVVELSDYRKYYEDLSNKIDTIGVATESFIQCKDHFKENVEKACTKINDKIAMLMREEPEMTHDQKVAFEQDLSAMNRMYTYYGKRQDGDHFTLVYDDLNQSPTLKFNYMDAMESPLVVSAINLHTPTDKKTNEKYIKSLFEKSKFAENNKTVKYQTVSGYSTLL